MPSADRVSTPYVQDILAQPDALRQTVAALREPDGLSNFARDLAGGKLSRIVLTGMGASYHALIPLHIRLIQAGLPAQLIETSELIYSYSALLSPDSLLIVVSQSGSSAEITHLLKQTGGRSSMIGVTNTPDSPLAREATGVLLTEAGSESSVACKTYVAALAALAWLGERLIEPSQDAVRDRLNGAAEAVERYLAGFDSHIDTLVELLAGVRYLTYVGRGASMAAVRTGAMIAKEAAHFQAEGMGSAAFRHGPLEAVSAEQFVMLYAGPADTAGLNEGLYWDIVAFGGKAALIGAAQGAGPLFLPATPPETAPILEVLPAQMISVALARLNDHPAGRFRFIGKVVATE